jgi:hypothetical protein
VSHRATAQLLNDLGLTSLNSEPWIHVCIDCEEEIRSLELEESSHAFKSVTNLLDQVDTRRGARVMFLENSLIGLKISNGTTGVVNGVSDEGNPVVIIPTVEGIQVSSKDDRPF